MVVHNTYKRKIRIKQEIEDLNAYPLGQEPDAIRQPKDDRLPILYIVSIEVKVWLIGWIRIWAKSCDLPDGDTRAAIYDEALKIQRIILGVY